MSTRAGALERVDNGGVFDSVEERWRSSERRRSLGCDISGPRSLVISLAAFTREITRLDVASLSLIRSSRKVRVG